MEYFIIGSVILIVILVLLGIVSDFDKSGEINERFGLYAMVILFVTYFTWPITTPIMLWWVYTKYRKVKEENNKK